MNETKTYLKAIKRLMNEIISIISLPYCKKGNPNLVACPEGN